MILEHFASINGTVSNKLIIQYEFEEAGQSGERSGTKYGHSPRGCTKDKKVLFIERFGGTGD